MMEEINVKYKEAANNTFRLKSTWKVGEKRQIWIEPLEDIQKGTIIVIKGYIAETE